MGVEVSAYLGMQLTFKEMTSSLSLITCAQSGFGNRSLLLSSYFNNMILRNISLEDCNPRYHKFPLLFKRQNALNQGVQGEQHAPEVPSKVARTLLFWLFLTHCSISVSVFLCWLCMPRRERKSDSRTHDIAVEKPP